MSQNNDRFTPAALYAHGRGTQPMVEAIRLSRSRVIRASVEGPPPAELALLSAIPTRADLFEAG